MEEFSCRIKRCLRMSVKCKLVRKVNRYCSNITQLALISEDCLQHTLSHQKQRTCDKSCSCVFDHIVICCRDSARTLGAVKSLSIHCIIYSVVENSGNEWTKQEEKDNVTGLVVIEKLVHYFFSLCLCI